MNISKKKTTILGAQRSGFSMARLVLMLGGVPKISDSSVASKITSEFNQWITDNRIDTEFEGHTKDFILDSDIVLLSPGVPIGAECVRWAKEAGIAVLGEIEFACQFIDARIIAITGSNGKTTVSTLIYEVLKKAGKTVALKGNIGDPLSEYCIERLDDKSRDGVREEYVVLEVSSFQMESLYDGVDDSIKRFRPYLSVLLNFSQNHLDRHKDLEDYFQAKWKIFKNQTSEDHAVINGSDIRLKLMASQLSAKCHFFNVEDQDQSNPNHLAVLKIANILNIPERTCNEMFNTFTGVEHRLEWVRQLEGIDFINDSKATTAEASRWALNSIDQPIYMICGGKDKNIDFAPLCDIVQKKVKGILTFGEAKEKINRTFKDVVKVDECPALKEAVMQARRQAAEGDCVLLSPMCASFDMFKDYEERGREFKEIVRRLK